jgi:hypothetical protein
MTDAFDTAEEIEVEELADKKDEDAFAYARSHEASKFAYETCKVIAQSCLLINGGAATAVVAMLSKDKVDQAALTWVPWGVAHPRSVSSSVRTCSFA